MPRTSAAYKNQLDQLECHFTWLKDHPITPPEVDNITKRLQNDLNISPNISITSLAFLSYLHTLPSTNMSTDTALECLTKVTQIDIDRSSVKCDFVIRANKLHICYLKGDVHHQDELALLLKEWEDRKENPILEAGVWATKAITLSRLGMSSYEKAIIHYNQASELEKENAHWYFGSAFLIGRIRRDRKGTEEPPSEEELRLWETANQKAQRKLPLFVRICLRLGRIREI